MANWLKEGIDAGGFAIYIKKKEEKKEGKKKKEDTKEQLALTF